MLVASFCENKSEYIPDAFYDILPIRCSEASCGYPMVMSETLSNLQCSNAYCPRKTARRMFELLKFIGITNITELSLKNYIVNNGITNVFSIFKYDFDTNGLLDNDLTTLTCKELSKKLKQNKCFTLVDYIRAAHLPYLQDSVDIIFNKVTDLNSFYENLSRSGYLYLCELLDIDTKKDDLVSVRVLKLVDIFKTYKDELLEGLHYIELR